MNSALEEMLAPFTTSFALYHLPGAKDVVCVHDPNPRQLATAEDMTEEKGYVIAPFRQSADCPMILLHPQRLFRLAIDELGECRTGTTRHYVCDEETQYDIYRENFRHVASALNTGQANKVVLARQMCLYFPDTSQMPAPLSLFITACRTYPHNFVSLWHTPQTGCWLVATPESLLEKVTDNLWHTMALAGTMTWQEGSPHNGHARWSRKNREEQQCVCDYIHNCILPHACRIEMSPTYPVQAGQLAHLRTDFTFSLRDDSNVGKLITQLHPTPAVCGMPATKAARIIDDAETLSRRYYSGYSGPWQLEGESRLYVSLRCMEWIPDKRQAKLYVGGGIMPTSHVDSEWKETVNKAETMLRVIRGA